jgi:excisionase family DNA binding protein
MASDPDRHRVVPTQGGDSKNGRACCPRQPSPGTCALAQVAELLQVSPKTVSRWAQEGMLPYFRTLGGHRRYPDREIRALLETLSEPSSAS